MFLFILFILIPLAEIAAFIKIGGMIGIGWTLTITFLTAVAGSTLLRHQGLATWTRANENLKENKFPARELFDGLCLLIAGITLITPGFVTDTLGFLLFLPPFRYVLFEGLKDYHKYASFTNFTMYTAHDQWKGRTDKPQDPNVIDGEYRELQDSEKSDRPEER